MNLVLYKTSSIKIRQFLTDFFTKGHERSIKVKKNIAASFIIKGLSIAISLVLVPLTINYINPIQYGIWLTLSSIVAWFSFFDIGLGNGLRNKFAETIAKGDYELARIYLSTTYAIIGIIAFSLMSLFFCINPLLNWASILNAPANMASELSILALLVFSFFCLQFFLQLITTIITANQQPAKASFLSLLGNLLSLALIFILAKTTSGKLIYLALSLGISPVLVLIAANIWFYNHEYKFYAPHTKYVKLRNAHDLLSLGIKFFIIQIAGVVLFGTSNIIIAQLFGPTEVTAYNIAFRYFSILSMIFGIVLAPYWSAFTEANVKKDQKWIRTTMKKLGRISFILVGIGIIMFIFSDEAYKLWIGNTVKVTKFVSFWMVLFVISSLLISPIVTFINGVGKIKVQFYFAVFSIIITIPLAFLLAKHFQMGPAGVITAMLCSNIPAIISLKLQYRKIIANKATGIWDK